MKKLKLYLKNLLCALAGHNPSKEELAEKQVRDYQNLTENLRQRLVDKDNLAKQMERYYDNVVSTMREHHRKQCEELAMKNQELRDDLNDTLDQLEKVNRDIAREMINTNALKKIDNALSDLCQVMASGDAEKVRQAVDYLGWSEYLERIAQHYLQVLIRVKELEEEIIENRDYV